MPEEENLARDFTVDDKSLVGLYHPKRQIISVSESQLNLEFSGSDSSAKFDHCNIILIVKSTVKH